MNEFVVILNGKINIFLGIFEFNSIIKYKGN